MCLSRVKFNPKNICHLTYHLVVDTIDEILDSEYPTELVIEILDGQGKCIKKIILRGVKFNKHITDYDLDYNRPGIMSHTVELKFTSIEWK